MSFGASLLQAAKAGAIERVAALLRDGHAGSLSTPDASGSTPLHLAAVSCRGPELPTMLLAAGADPSQQNKFRQTPLHFACACGNIHAAAVLIGCGGVDTQEAKGMTPLMLAAKRGAADLVCLLLAQGRADPLLQDHQGLTARAHATSPDMKKLVTQLLACKVDVNQARWDGATPLLVATRKRAMAAVKLLINAGADVNQADLEGCSPLLEAATMVDARLVGWLLQAGANANTHNIVGETPLMRSSVQDRPEVVELLLAHGADVNACEHDLGFTALTFAASQGCASVAKVLLAHGADPASTNKHGQMTALHLACRAGHLGVVAAVLAVPGGAAAVDLQDSKGLTPLMAAAMAGHTSVCAALMDAGASSSLKARGGHTAMSLAIDHHHKAVVQLLASRGVPGPAARPGSKQIHRAGPAPSRSLNALITDSPQGPSPSPSSPDLTGTAGQHFIMGASPTSRFAPAHKATRSEESPAVLPHQPFTALDSPNTPHLAISSPVLLGPTTAQNSFAGSDCTSASTLSLAAVQPTLHAASPKVSEAGAAGAASRASPLPRSRLAPPGPPSPSLTSHPASLAKGTQPVAGAARCESGSEQGRGRQGQAGPGASESGSWILGPGVPRGKKGEGAVTISRSKSDRHLQSSTPPAATPPSATQVRPAHPAHLPLGPPHLR
ncbi:ankyrin repeat-containing domain protein [Haematococcus lacustris]